MSAADFCAVLLVALLGVLWAVLICGALVALALVLVFGPKRDDDDL